MILCILCILGVAGIYGKGHKPENTTIEQKISAFTEAPGLFPYPACIIECKFGHWADEVCWCGALPWDPTTFVCEFCKDGWDCLNKGEPQGGCCRSDQVLCRNGATCCPKQEDGQAGLCCGDNNCCDSSIGEFCCGGECVNPNRGESCCEEVKCTIPNALCCGQECYNPQVNHCCTDWFGEVNNVCRNNQECCAEYCLSPNYKCCRRNAGDFLCPRAGGPCCNNQCCGSGQICTDFTQRCVSPPPPFL